MFVHHFMGITGEDILKGNSISQLYIRNSMHEDSDIARCHHVLETSDMREYSGVISQSLFSDARRRQLCSVTSVNSIWRVKPKQ